MAKKKDSLDHGDRNNDPEPDFNDAEGFVDDIPEEGKDCVFDFN